MTTCSWQSPAAGTICADRGTDTPACSLGCQRRKRDVNRPVGQVAQKTKQTKGESLYIQQGRCRYLGSETHISSCYGAGTLRHYARVPRVHPECGVLPGMCFKLMCNGNRQMDSLHLAPTTPAYDFSKYTAATAVLLNMCMRLNFLLSSASCFESAVIFVQALLKDRPVWKHIINSSRYVPVGLTS